MFKLKTIDNFLKLDDLNFLSKIKLDNIEKNNVKVYHNTIDKNGNINSSCIDENKIKTLQDNYHSKAIQILEELCPEKIKLYDYSEFHVVKSGSEYKFPIHDDMPSKLLSGVIYLQPEIIKEQFFTKIKMEKEKMRLSGK